MSAARFLFQFLASPGLTGAIAPSSDALAELITDSANLGTARAVVEWGSGTGVFTEKILSKKSKAMPFLAFEKNHEMAMTTRVRCPGALVIHDSALHTRKHLRRHGLSSCDSVVCSLPWATFPDRVQSELLDALSGVLSKGGTFVTYAYLPGLLLPGGRRFRRKLHDRFSSVRTTRVIWPNLPPAFVYCVKR